MTLKPPREIGPNDADNGEHDTCGNLDASSCGVLRRQIHGIESYRLIQIYPVRLGSPKETDEEAESNRTGGLAVPVS